MSSGKKLPSPIGQRLQRVRTMVELPARELDRLAGITEGHTSLVESVVENASASTVAKLARVLGVSTDWLITGEGKEPSERAVRAAVDASRGEFSKSHSTSKPAA